MGNEKFEHISRVLPLILAAGETELDFSLLWSLPGNVSEYNEPELTVMDVEAQALENQICIRFSINQETYYVDEKTGLVEKASTTHQQTRLLPVDNIKPGDLVQVDVAADLRGNWQAVRSKDGTSFKGDCRLSVGYTVQEQQEVMFYKPAQLDGEILAESLSVESIHSRFARTIDLAIPAEFTEAPASLAKIEAELVNVKATSLFAWVKVEGEVVAQLPYLNNEGQPCEEMVVYPVKQYLEVPEARPDMEVAPGGRVEIFTCQHEDGEKAGTLRGLLHIQGRLSRLEPLNVALQARSHQSFYHGHKPHQYPHDKPFWLEQVVGTGSSQTLIQREIIFVRRARKVREPVDARVRNLRHEIIPNKVIVRGVLHKQIMAVDAETSVVFSQDVREDFVHFVDVPGASPGMRAHVDARVEFVKVDIHPGGETARQVTIIEIRVKVTRPVKKDVVVSPISPPHKPVKPPAKPEKRVYTVRSGDSVWKIANMFGVSMESIIRANNLQNPDLIFPGQQLIIPR
ncbi:LysM peptidoglycan-binding domain-containing protein [Dethiobacter alkaliphilus]|uniref:Peptidoglycan-binding LysM n=1 Tax=Dethiobacter alkaliphilus AHT 1 TaxID=555088 RepID=C0GJB7_DETAL|nr:LysM peptidoglycan-binding domain-containing protein [Dethiobacter alkaliphilus]EEG76602.1 Peptidoglycan-binding LysM [Dethiobacter alkaliphilus AHT 1]